jgi:hypothetical protein
VPIRERAEGKMSDHDDEVNGTAQDPESKASDSFSRNGHQPDGRDYATDGFSDADDGTAFLADLARAMQTTAAAEQARNAEGTEQRRQTHIDAIRAREALEAEELRELAKEDVHGIDAWSDGEIKRIKLERERRIAARREQLQIRLEEHRHVVGREVENVEAAIGVYRAEIDLYFQRLGSETDPVAIARHAGTRPAFPVLELIGPDDAPGATEYRHLPSSAPVVAEVTAPTKAVETTPVEVEPPEATTAEPAEAEAETATPMIGVMDPDAGGETNSEQWETGADDAAAVAEDDAEPVRVGAEAASESDEAPEPVGVVAESRVVMPRSTGAGSWLRWPNSSADHSDSGH